MELNEHKDAIEKALNEAITDYTIKVRAVDFSESLWSRTGDLYIRCDLFKKH